MAVALSQPKAVVMHKRPRFSPIVPNLRYGTRENGERQDRNRARGIGGLFSRETSGKGDGA